DQHDTINDNKTGDLNDSNAVTIEENNVGANIEFRYLRIGGSRF
ncbi:4624_t:CDS:2, partial [Cetraspora pellucida]